MVFLSFGNNFFISHFYFYFQLFYISLLYKKLKDATDKLTQEKVDIILLDINVEGPDTGIEWAKTNVEKEKVIFITGQNEISTLEKA